MSPHVEDGCLTFTKEIISLMNLQTGPDEVTNHNGETLQIATKPLSHSDPAVYFRPDLDLLTLRHWVYPITGEPKLSWPGNSIQLDLNGWRVKEKVPPNTNISCCVLVISVLNEMKENV